MKTGLGHVMQSEETVGERIDQAHRQRGLPHVMLSALQTEIAHHQHGR